MEELLMVFSYALSFALCYKEWKRKKKKKKEFKSFAPDNNQELLQLMTTSFTLMTLMPDSGGDIMRRN